MLLAFSSGVKSFVQESPEINAGFARWTAEGGCPYVRVGPSEVSPPKNGRESFDKLRAGSGAPL